jgi:DNA-binding transcriptional ArsR family regulator
LQYAFHVSYADDVATEWTFLTNHSHVLLSIGSEPELTVREIAQRVGITERAAQRIVADLIDAGYLQAERVGRRNQYTINGELPLRHPLEARNPVRALLALTAPPSKKKRAV